MTETELRLSAEKFFTAIAVAKDEMREEMGEDYMFLLHMIVQDICDEALELAPAPEETPEEMLSRLILEEQDAGEAIE